MHTVAVVAFDGVVPFDLTIATEVLGRCPLPNGAPAYKVVVCGMPREIDVGAYQIKLWHGLSEVRRADTVILPGVEDITRPVPPELIRVVRQAARSGARVASICTGAFLLAATGLLDGRRATTHWLAAAELTRRYPKISVDPNVLYVDEGNILTSAGAAAGVDLCLHLIRRDYGAAVAARSARLTVMPLQRDGGQAQFIEHPAPPTDVVSLSRVLDWLEQNLDNEHLSLASIAKRAGMSVRTLSRQFRAQTGSTPLHWLHLARIKRAKVLLETTSLSIDRVASSTGFGSVASFRIHFGRTAGTSPLAYRRAFQTRSASA